MISKDQCRKKPNRTFPRYFKLCDGARIARQIASDNKEQPEVVLSCIAKGFGFTHISLSRQRLVEAGVDLSKGRVKILVSLIKKGLELISKNFPRLAKFIIPILKALDELERIVDKILNAPDQATVEEILEGKCACKDQPKPKEVN